MQSVILSLCLLRLSSIPSVCLLIHDVCYLFFTPEFSHTVVYLPVSQSINLSVSASPPSTQTRIKVDEEGGWRERQAIRRAGTEEDLHDLYTANFTQTPSVWSITSHHLHHQLLTSPPSSISDIGMHGAFMSDLLLSRFIPGSIFIFDFVFYCLCTFWWRKWMEIVNR